MKEKAFPFSAFLNTLPVLKVQDCSEYGKSLEAQFEYFTTCSLQQSIFI